ncbi:MarR family winged helix-turn-helix transcriptional regulator [Microbacterium sp. CIAB417]|uniref:MarR family winged helix-turn-helix transcriptional regulator n=1 Tax=Microbacterium sp. CIAB417 TaxID=2860287 RepID=UPI001FAB73F6|nr:MarR family transcriptional regulator [Microbacterium sp. CIAB417]
MTSHSTTPDISPVFDQDPLDIRLAIASIIHWADGREVREAMMRYVRFPTDDIPMFLVVNQLAYRGALRPTDLASTLGTGKANMSKIVRRLEEAGLVTRIASETDERSILVALTPAGREIGHRIVEGSEAHYRSVIEGWNDEDIAELQRLLARFARGAMLELARRSPALALPR